MSVKFGGFIGQYVSLTRDNRSLSRRRKDARIRRKSGRRNLLARNKHTSGFALSNASAACVLVRATEYAVWSGLRGHLLRVRSDGSCDALPKGPCGFNQWIFKGSAKPIEPARKLFEAAKAKGVAVIFITGRTDSQRDITILNLDHAGFEGWTELRTRPDRDDLPTVQEFKTAERTKVEAEGYTIIADVGDQISDLEGEHSGLTSRCRILSTLSDKKRRSGDFFGFCSRCVSSTRPASLGCLDRRCNYLRRGNPCRNCSLSTSSFSCSRTDRLITYLDISASVKDCQRQARVTI